LHQINQAVTVSLEDAPHALQLIASIVFHPTTTTQSGTSVDAGTATPRHKISKTKKDGRELK